MAMQLVDVVIGGDHVATYLVNFQMLNTSVRAEDYYAEARVNLREDGYSDEEIRGATFSLRDPEPT